jgi:hypothetical protein
MPSHESILSFARNVQYKTQDGRDHCLWRSRKRALRADVDRLLACRQRLLRASELGKLYSKVVQTAAIAVAAWILQRSGRL